MMTTRLAVSIVLCSVATIFFACSTSKTKQYNSNNNNDNNYNTDGTSCTYDQQKYDNHDGSNATTEAFVLTL
jgi:hypothetical protein